MCSAAPCSRLTDRPVSPCNIACLNPDSCCCHHRERFCSTTVECINLHSSRVHVYCLRILQTMLYVVVRSLCNATGRLMQCTAASDLMFACNAAQSRPPALAFGASRQQIEEGLVRVATNDTPAL